MLKYADKSDVEHILSFTNNGAFATKIKSIILSYGIESELVDLWFDSNNTVILRFDGAVTLYSTDRTDTDEVKSLLNVVGCNSVFGEYICLSKMYDRCRSGSIMKYKGGKYVFHCEDAIERLREIYTLISDNIPDSFSESGYMYWLSDFMHRYFGEYSRARCVVHDEKAVACCITAAETEKSAVISGVACCKEYRGKGFGKQCVIAMADELQKEKKDVFVFVLNESAVGFYKKTGFIECGKWAEIKF